MNDEPDYKMIADSLKAGTCVPFLGAGASVASGVPSAGDLVQRLIKATDFADKEGRDSLAFLASYFLCKKGKDINSLRLFLREQLLTDAKPGTLHDCLAGIPQLTLIVTTNYDDLIEQAFRIRDRNAWTIVDKNQPSQVRSRNPDGAWKLLDPRKLDKAVPEDATVIYKMHGSLDRTKAAEYYYLITEEQYVEFLGRSPDSQVPPMLAGRMRSRNFLFLGYGLKDWNVRVMLTKIAPTSSRAEPINSWAIVRKPNRAEAELWQRQGVLMYDVDLEKFVDRLAAEL